MFLILKNFFECFKITFENDIWNIQLWYSVNIQTLECFLRLIQFGKSRKLISKGGGGKEGGGVLIRVGRGPDKRGEGRRLFGTEE